MDRVRQYEKYCQLKNASQQKSIINMYDYATLGRHISKKTDKEPVLYLYADNMGVLRFRNMIYGAKDVAKLHKGQRKGGVVFDGSAPPEPSEPRGADIVVLEFELPFGEEG